MRRLMVCAVGIVFVLVLSACGSSTKTTSGSTVSTATSVANVPATAAASLTTPVPVAAVASPTATISPTPIATPPPSPVAAVKNLQVVTSGFGEDDNGQVGYAFIVKNPNASLGVADSAYQVAAYDANGTVLKTDSNYINSIAPGQTLGVGGSLYVDKSQKVAKIEVQVSTGNTGPMSSKLDLTTGKATYSASEYGSAHVTGVVNNAAATDAKQVLVSALAYDASGKIIGGGFTFVDFVPANGHAAADVQVTTSGTPAKAELYAAPSALSNP